LNLPIKNNFITKILKREKLLFWSIFLLGLLLRITFIILWDRRLNYDTQNYIAQAEAILNGSPVSGFPNGYPLIIAAIIILAGKNLIFPVMISLNLLAQFFTGYFLYRITKILYSDSINLRKSAKISENQRNTNNSSITDHLRNPREIKKSNLFTFSTLLIFAVYPTQILYTNSVLTETFTTLFITASVYGILTNSYFLGGMSIAIASMLRTLYLPALAITFLYILYKNIRENLRNPRAGQQKINQSITQSINQRTEQQTINHSIIQSPFMKYLLGLALVLSFFALLDILNITKFPENQNYNLLIAINGRSSSINHNISNFSESEFLSPLQTYLNFAHNNTKEFIIQRADALWGLWGVFPFETHHLYSKLLLSIRIFLFLSWIYWLYIFFRRQDIYRNNIFHKFLILLSIFIITITIIHTMYFSSFRFIVPIEPLLLIMFVFTTFNIYSKIRRISYLHN
jgi:hypothetical protein